MATLIDSLIVSLELDPKGFIKGGKQAASDIVKVRDQAVGAAKQIEAAGKSAAQFFSQLRNEVIGLFAAFTAGRGLEEFIKDITVANAELGRMAKNLDLTTETLSAWQGAARSVGGTAAGVTGSIQSLSNSFQNFLLTGQSSTLQYFRALHVAIAGSNGQLRPVTDILFDLADRFSHMDPARANAIGRSLGLDQGTINLLIEGTGALKARLDMQTRLGVATKEDVKWAALLQQSWSYLSQASESLGRSLATWLSPVMVRINSALTELAIWARGHGDFVKALFIGLSVAATALGIALLAPIADILLFVAALAAAATGIALLYDDWSAWTKGGKALFSDFYQFVYDKWRELEPTVRPIIETISKLWADLWTGIKDGWKIVVALLTGSAKDIEDAFSVEIADLKRMWSDYIDYIRSLGPAMLDAFKGAFASAFDWLKNRFNIIWSALTGHNLFGDVPGGDAGEDAGPGGDGSHVGGFRRPRTGGGGNTIRDMTNYTGSNAEVVKQAAKQLGTTPEDLAMVIGYETGGTYSPSKWGGKDGNYMGLIQFGPSERAQFGANDKQTFAQQMPAVVSYLKTRGFKPGMSLLDLYSTINAGSPGHYGASDGNGTVSGHVARMRATYGATVRKFLNSGSSPYGGLDGAHAAMQTATAAQGGIISNYDRSVANSSSSQVTIGDLHVHTQATDSSSIAADIKPALKRGLLSTQGNYGQW